MRRFLASCFLGDAAALRGDKAEATPCKDGVNAKAVKQTLEKHSDPRAGIVDPGSHLPVLDRDAFLDTFCHLQGFAVAAVITSNEGLSSKASNERHFQPHLQSVWMQSHNGRGHEGHKSSSLLTGFQPSLGVLGDFLLRDETLRTGLETAARCASENQYCRVRHRLKLGDEGMKLHPEMASVAYAMVEIGSCVLALSAQERKPGVFLAAKAAPEKPAAATAPAPERGLQQRIVPTCPAEGGLEAAASAFQLGARRPAERQEGEAAASLTTAAVIPVHGKKDGTSKCHVSADKETQLAARSIAAESIPAIVMAIMLDRCGEPDVLVYVNQQGRDYLGLGTGGHLPRLDCRGLLLLLLEDSGLSLDEVLAEAAKEQGFTATLRAPAEVQPRSSIVDCGDGDAACSLGRSATADSFLGGVTTHAPMNGIAECPSCDELEDEEIKEEEQEQEGERTGGQSVPREEEERVAATEQETLQGATQPQGEELSARKAALGRALQTLLGAPLDRQASLSISEGYRTAPLQCGRKGSFTLTGRLLQRRSVASSAGIASRADSFALVTPQDSLSHGHPAAGAGSLADGIRQRHALAAATTATASMAVGTAQDAMTDQLLLQRLANTTVAKQARDVCFQNTPPQYHQHTTFSTSRQASSSLEKQDGTAAAAGRRGLETATGFGSGAGGQGITPSPTNASDAFLDSPSNACSRPTPSSTLALLAPGVLPRLDSTPLPPVFLTAPNGDGPGVPASRPGTTSAATVCTAAVLNGQSGWSTCRTRRQLRRVVTTAPGDLARRVAAEANKGGGNGGGGDGCQSVPPQRADASASSISSGPAGAGGGNGPSRLKALYVRGRLGRQESGGELKFDEEVPAVASAAALADAAATGDAAADESAGSYACAASSGARGAGAPGVAVQPAPGAFVSLAPEAGPSKAAGATAAAQPSSSDADAKAQVAAAQPFGNAMEDSSWHQSRKQAPVDVGSGSATPSATPLATLHTALSAHSVCCQSTSLQPAVKLASCPRRADGLDVEPSAAAAVAIAADGAGADAAGASAGADADAATTEPAWREGEPGPSAPGANISSNIRQGTKVTTAAAAPIGAGTAATVSINIANRGGAFSLSTGNNRRSSDLDVIRTFCCAPAIQPENEPKRLFFDEPVPLQYARKDPDPVPFTSRNQQPGQDQSPVPHSLPSGPATEETPSLPEAKGPPQPTSAAAIPASAAPRSGREQVVSHGARHLGNSQGWAAAAMHLLGPSATENLAALSSASGVLSSGMHSSGGSQHQPPAAGWLQPCPMAPSGSSGQWADLSGRRNSGVLPPMAQALSTAGGSSFGAAFRCRSMGQDASSYGCSRIPSGSLRHPGASLLSSVGFDGGLPAERSMWDSTTRTETAGRMQRNSLDQQRIQHQHQQPHQLQHQPQQQQPPSQHHQQQLRKFAAASGGDLAGAMGSGDAQLLGSRGQGSCLRSPVSGPPSSSCAMTMRQFARLSSGPVPGVGGAQQKRPNSIRTRLFSLLEQMDGDGGLGAGCPAGSLLGPAGQLHVGSVPARRASAVTNPTTPPLLRQHSARRASTTVLEHGGGVHLSCKLKDLMELGGSGGGSRFANGSFCGASDGHSSATGQQIATHHVRDSLAGMATCNLTASGVPSGNDPGSSMGMFPMPGVGGTLFHGSDVLSSSIPLHCNAQLGVRMAMGSGCKGSSTLPEPMIGITATAFASASMAASASASASASGAGGVGGRAGVTLLEQEGSGTMGIVGPLRATAVEGLLGESPGTLERTSSLDTASRPASQSMSMSMSMSQSQPQHQHRALLSRSPTQQPELLSNQATQSSLSPSVHHYLTMQQLQHNLAQQVQPPQQQQQQQHSQPQQLLQFQAQLQPPTFRRAGSGGSTPFVGPLSGGMARDACAGDVPSESPRAAAAAAAATVASAGSGGSAGAAWFRLHMRALSTPGDGGGGTLLLMMQDLTLQITAQEKVTTLLGHEHKILEALFPRHVIEFMTVIPLGLEGDGPRLRRGVDGGCDGGCYQDGEPEAEEDMRCSATASGVRQLIMSRQLDVIKVSHLATQHKMVTILFSDCVGFTAMCKKVSPYTVMHFLNELYQKLDALLDIYKVYKVETIGDCYVVAGGLVRYDSDGYCSVLPEGETDELHAVRVMEFAKAMLRVSRDVLMPTTGEAVQLRLGLHSGPAMSGVVGSKMPRFTVFGETVEAAHKMESSGCPGRIHVSGVTRELLRREQWEQTEGVQMDGGGRVDTYLWVEEEQEDALSKQRVLAVYI